MRYIGSTTALVGLTAAALLFSVAPASLAQVDAELDILIVKMIDKGVGQWRFDPADVTVERGDVVRFVQQDIVPHNVEFTQTAKGTDLSDGAMGPFLMTKGEIYDVVIDERFAEGMHAYVCTPHAPMGMTGTITVGGVPAPGRSE